MVHGYLAASYWAAGIPREVVARSIAHSLPFGLYHGERQIGFARAVTDRTTFAYLGDVFVLEEFQGRGLGTWLMERIVVHPDLQGRRECGIRNAECGIRNQVLFRIPYSVLRIEVYRR